MRAVVSLCAWLRFRLGTLRKRNKGGAGVQTTYPAPPSIKGVTSEQPGKKVELRSEGLLPLQGVVEPPTSRK